MVICQGMSCQASHESGANVKAYMVQVDIRLFKVEVVRVFRDARGRICLKKCEECEKVDGRNEHSDRDCPVREHVHCELVVAGSHAARRLAQAYASFGCVSRARHQTLISGVSVGSSS